MILNNDEALNLIEDSIANDEERWVTMNGRHVLIRNGEPVGLNISKATPAMKGGKFSKPKENIKKISAEEKAERKKTNHVISLQEERRAKELAKVDNELEEVDKKHDNDWRYVDAFGRAKRLGKKKLAERIKEKGKRVENERQAERDRLYRKKDRIWKDTDKRQSALRQKNLDRWNKAQEKISKEINKGVAAKQALEKARPKIQSAREANRYLAERRSNIKKATPDMVGGKFRNLTGERKDILNKIRTGAPLAKQRADAEQRKADNIIGRYRDMAGRIEKRGIGDHPFEGNRLANRVRERGEDLARPHSEKSSGYLRSWADRRDRLSNEYSKSVDREEAAKEALKNYRSKRK